ncbi:MAG TPA: CehA/McbA family metallohydrolase [Clostridia bacterium]|nr:CehA/McbA family metallohydrolase [Clostridia bacterium]
MPTMPIHQTRTFTRRIEKPEERRLLRIPFDMPVDVETLTVAYAYERRRLSEFGPGHTVSQEINIVDLALEDGQGRLVGASGSERLSVTIHENHATPGYRPTPLTPGTWHLVLGAYRIEEDGCPVEITLSFAPKGGVLLRGDCHLHSAHSDGWYAVDALLDRARQDRLDYLFLTDHNSTAGNDLLRSDPDLTVLPGVEMTYYDGHYNLFGVAHPVRTYVANGREDVLSILREGRESGALCAINHPMCPNCGWHFGFGPDVPADLIEVWNGPFEASNRAAVALWHERLCQGRRWPAIGGSDCHHDELFRIPATPTTFLYSRSRSGSDILEAMRLGHAYVGMGPNAPGIHMALGAARMGDVHAGPSAPLEMVLTGLTAQDEVRILDQAGIVWQEKPGPAARFEAEIPARDSRFLRAEIWRALPGFGTTLASLGNPIYLEA